MKATLKPNFFLLALLLAVVAMSGCARNLIPPTFAHIHIGHALSGWIGTPGKVGLLVTAEEEAIIAKANATLLVKATQSGNLQSAKRHLLNIGHALDPETYPDGNGKGYGLRKATLGAISHLEFAADSDDATDNVITSVVPTAAIAQRALEQCDEVLALVGEALQINDLAVMQELAVVIKQMTSDIAGGPQKFSADAYGLFEFRNDIEAMADREDPVYTTADTYYLYNLVLTPDGDWVISKKLRTMGDSRY